MSDFEQKKYKLRDLEATDIIPMVKLIRTFGVDEFKGLASLVKDISTTTDKEGNEIITLGLDFVFEVVNIIINNLPKCEDSIFKFLSSISDLSEDEVRHLKLNEFTQMLIDFINKDEFKGFFSVVQKLLK